MSEGLSNYYLFSACYKLSIVLVISCRFQNLIFKNSCIVGMINHLLKYENKA